MHNLHRFLVDYDIAMLRTLAQCRGIPLATNRQRDAVDQMAKALLDPLSLRLALAHLSDPGRQALETLLAAGGKMRVPHFFRQFGDIRPVGPGRLEREEPWRHPANASEELWYAGLLFRAFDQDRAGPGEFVFVPDDLLSLLPQPQVEGPPFALQMAPSPEASRGRGPSLVRDLFVYLVHVHNHDVHPYADGRLARRDRVALRERIPDLDQRRLALVQHLAEQLGFVTRPGSSLRLEAGAARRWLTASPDQRLAVLQQAWRDDPSWDDLCRVPGLACDQVTAWLPRSDPVATRRALLALLARCLQRDCQQPDYPQQGWWTLPSFVAAVKSSHPDFQRPDGDYGSWYIRDTATGDYLSGFETWDRVEGALIADLLTGPLQWLGVVDIATPQPGQAHDTPVLCRVTEAGSRLLELAPPLPVAPATPAVPKVAVPPPAPPLVVHADFRVEVLASENLFVRFQLERFADLESEEPCCYHLTVRSLGRALARGVRGEQVLAFLQQASDGSLPANVAGQLRLWAGRFGQVKLEELALLTAENERVMRELFALPETRDLIGQVLSPTTALVEKKHLPRLQRVLQVLGFLPPDRSPGDLSKRG
jgi:hypothetical protein